MRSCQSCEIQERIFQISMPDNSSAVKESVHKAVTSVSGRGRESIHMKTRLSDLGIDSLGRTVIAAIVAEELDIVLGPEALFALIQGDTLAEIARDISRSIRRHIPYAGP